MNTRFVPYLISAKQPDFVEKSGCLNPILSAPQVDVYLSCHRPQDSSGSEHYGERVLTQLHLLKSKPIEIYTIKKAISHY
jgi:hypothetical protein